MYSPLTPWPPDPCSAGECVNSVDVVGSDTQNSRLRFSGKAILHSEGVDFSSGQSFSLRLSDLELQEELGKGNYGTVVHVIHRVTNAHMAMKQIKLELDNSKFMAIITELQVLHEAKTDLIVDFYGGFFAESCVFICMEYVPPLLRLPSICG